MISSIPAPTTVLSETLENGGRNGGRNGLVRAWIGDLIHSHIYCSRNGYDYSKAVFGSLKLATRSIIYNCEAPLSTLYDYIINIHQSPI
jgi:hypothetical protein